MIKSIKLQTILNSRKQKTIQALIKTENGTFYGNAPSGASAGRKEALYKPLPFVKKLFSKIRKNMIGFPENKLDIALEKVGINRIGANLTVALSIAAAKASSNDNFHAFKKKFPIPLGVVIGGGKHGKRRGIQEFLVFANKAKSVGEAITTNKKIHKRVGEYLKKKKLLAGKELEGGWISKADDIKNLEIVKEIASKYKAEVGLDLAASEFWDGKHYCYDNNISDLSKNKSNKAKGRIYSKTEKLTPYEQLIFVQDLIKSFKLKFVEDAFHEDDFKNHALLTNNISGRTKQKKQKAKSPHILICGDDLLVSNPIILQKAIKLKACNSILIKPNQIGTVSLTLKTIELAKKNGYKHIVSHRAGETLDPFIADLAVRTGAILIKCGIAGKEREAKLNRLKYIWKKVKKPRMSRV